jgi:hypothetical protein
MAAYDRDPRQRRPAVPPQWQRPAPRGRQSSWQPQPPPEDPWGASQLPPVFPPGYQGQPNAQGYWPSPPAQPQNRPAPQRPASRQARPAPPRGAPRSPQVSRTPRQRPLPRYPRFPRLLPRSRRGPSIFRMVYLGTHPVALVLSMIISILAVEVWAMVVMIMVSVWALQCAVVAVQRAAAGRP